MTSLVKRWAACTALSTSLVIGLAAPPARADEQTVKLIKLLIEKGILTSGQAQDLLKETAGPAARRHGKAPSGAPAEAEEPEAAPGQIRVTYVPDFIRKQIADQVRAQVMDEAQQEGWATPNALPEWTQRIKIFGDLRMRYDADMFDNNNYGNFINYSALNNGNPFDVANYGTGSGQQTNPPFLNSTEDRNRFRLRARLGIQALIDDWVSTEIRVGTGNDPTPTLNQTLGQNGPFDKYQLWLDRANFEMRPFPNVTIEAGRFDSPFMPSDLMFYYDLGFDGLALKYRQPLGGPFSMFVNAGGFPLFNTSFDYSTNSYQKYGSNDQYMAALQAGLEWQVRADLKATLGVGIFDFLGVQGAISDPCYEQLGPAGTYYCNTDNTRTTFWQFGNSVYPIRNIVPVGAPTTSSNPPEPEYYGLASRFDVLDVHPMLDITTYHPFDVLLEGEFIKNLAFNRNAIVNHGIPLFYPLGPDNNRGGAPGYNYEGGDTGWEVKVTLGDLVIHKLWDWNTTLQYRYLESDATLSALADEDFHDGGTNAQGYVVGGSLGIARNTWLALRLLAAQAVTGPHYGVDSVFLDLNSTF